MHRIEERLTEVRSRVAQAAMAVKRQSEEILILGVSKRQSAEKMRQAYALGMRDFGENYLQEALQKQNALADLNIQWHFIGPIQSNKTRAIAQHFDWVHSVDRLKIALRLSEQRESDDPINICVQVNIDNEASKSGAKLNELSALIKSIACLPKLKLRGLMIIPLAYEEKRQQLDVFKRARNLLESLNRDLNLDMDTLSMGMSGDLDAAIAEGATIVRIGTAIFGERTTEDQEQSID